MTHLKIEQNTSYTENVSLDIIEALYNIAKNEHLDNESDLLGTIRGYCYEDAKLYLESHYPNLHINVINNDPYIRFEDSATEQACATMYGSNGKLTKGQANSVNTIGYDFENSTIVNFDEFRYFTGVTSIEASKGFRYVTALRKITLPSTVTSIGYASFRKTGIESINLENVITIGNEAFYGKDSGCPDMLYNYRLNAPNLQSIGYKAFAGTLISYIDNLGSITNLGDETFSGCTNLKKVILPDTIQSLSGGVFGSCSSLLEITNLDKLTSIGINNFGTAALSDMSVVNFKNLTTLSVGSSNPQSCLCFSNSVKQIYIPEIGSLSLGGYHNGGNAKQGYFCRGGWNYTFTHDIIYLKNITTIGSGAFSCCTSKIVINNNVPPAIVQPTGTSIPSTNSSTDLFYGTGALIQDIYVPHNALSTYLQANGWSSISSYIHSINDLNSGVIYSNQSDWEEAGKPVALIADKLGLSTADLATFVSTNNLTYYVPSGN